ncbi:hypothetical protein EN853_33105, partial [Mesorhizobium sp. M1C.F.Ca.ET.210.01.1.1]
MPRRWRRIARRGHHAGDRPQPALTDRAERIAGIEPQQHALPCTQPFSQPRYTGLSFLQEARDRCAIDAAVFPLDGLTLPAPARRGEPGIHG